jgi:hypothetical protein
MSFIFLHERQSRGVRSDDLTGKAYGPKSVPGMGVVSARKHEGGSISYSILKH